MNRISQKELNRIYMEILADHRTGMLSPKYFITKFTAKDDELVFAFDDTMPLKGRWVCKSVFELVEDEPD